MHMRPGRTAGASDGAQQLSLHHPVANLHVKPLTMEKSAGQPHAMIDDQQMALQRERRVSPPARRRRPPARRRAFPRVPRCRCRCDRCRACPDRRAATRKSPTGARSPASGSAVSSRPIRPACFAPRRSARVRRGGGAGNRRRSMRCRGTGALICSSRQRPGATAMTRSIVRPSGKVATSRALGPASRSKAMRKSPSRVSGIAAPSSDSACVPPGACPIMSAALLGNPAQNEVTTQRS